MSRTIEAMRSVACAVATTTVVTASSPLAAQTIAELAQAQRTKQQSEIARLQREAAAMELELAVPLKQPEPVKLSAEEQRKAARRVADAARPKVVLHSLYSRNGIWVAELSEGQRLAMALVGMQIYGYRVLGMDQRGLRVTKPCTAADVRDKAACGERILHVGEGV